MKLDLFPGWLDFCHSGRCSTTNGPGCTARVREIFTVPSFIYFARPKVRHLNVATFRQNVGLFRNRPALWRGAATSHIGPREVYPARDRHPGSYSLAAEGFSSGAGHQGRSHFRIGVPRYSGNPFGEVLKRSLDTTWGRSFFRLTAGQFKKGCWRCVAPSVSRQSSRLDRLDRLCRLNWRQTLADSHFERSAELRLSAASHQGCNPAGQSL